MALIASNRHEFEVAFALLKDGRISKIRRLSWPKGQFVALQKGYPDGINCNKQTAEAWGINEGDTFKCAPYLQIQADGTHYMWQPSTADLFAEDWMVIE